MSWLIGLVLLASAHAGPAEEAVIQALLPRDGAPPCAEVAPELEGSERLDALVEVAEGVEHPPWVPLRAAGCVARLAAHDADAREIALAWAEQGEAPGRVLVVLQHLDAWPAPRAITLADRAVDLGRRHERFALYARPLLRRSTHAEVRERAERLPAAPTRGAR